MTSLVSTFIAFNTLNPFVDRFQEGGPFFMSLILISFLLTVYFIILSSRNLNKNVESYNKYLSLTTETGLLALVLGVLGSVIGLIETFDSIEGFNKSVSAPLIAGGLKVTFLTLVFGSFTFIISRIAIIVLKWLDKQRLH